MKTTKLLFGIITITTALAVQIKAQSFLTNGLIAYYSFNGNANDASGNGHNGMTNNNVILATDRFGNPSRCYSFNGANSFITVSNSSDLSPIGDFSVTLWIKQNSTSYPQVLLSKNLGTDNSAGWEVTLQDPFNQYPGGLQFQAAPDFNPVNPNITPLGLGVWFQACYTFTRSSGLCQGYLNGMLVDTKTNFYTASVSPRNLTFGAAENVGVGQYDFFFNGQLDDVRIYNRALSQSEVAQLHAIESAPICKIQKAVYLTSDNLWTGSNYQIQVSSDLINWTNQGSVFSATTNYWRSTNYWDVANWNQLYFRLQLAP